MKKEELKSSNSNSTYNLLYMEIYNKLPNELEKNLIFKTSMCRNN